MTVAAARVAAPRAQDAYFEDQDTQDPIVDQRCTDIESHCREHNTQELYNELCHAKRIAPQRPAAPAPAAAKRADAPKAAAPAPAAEKKADAPADAPKPKKKKVRGCHAYVILLPAFTPWTKQ